MLKKFRLVISITLAMFLGVGLTGCSDTDTQEFSDYSQVGETDPLSSSGMVAVNRTSFEDFSAYTLYDSDTKVMYLYIDGIRAGDLTVMVNADGTPKLYEPQD